ncbi:MAG: transposase, partial [Gemmatimonadota bacterium]
MPSSVERDFRAYLRCGILAHGFARVLPWLPVRQWVLSVPKRLRPYLHSEPKIASGVLKIFLRAVRSTLHATSPGVPASVSGMQIGAVSFLHRFGSSLNAHLHDHVVVLDGVFLESDRGGVEFHEASELEPRHWQELQHTVQKRVLRYFRRHDLLGASTTADMLTWQGTGGFSIDASVRIEGHDRHGLERLVRYCARPPFALHRLHAMGGKEALTAPDARLLYRLPGPTPDGRTVLILSPVELLQRLAPLVPPPRMHRHRYYGVLAPNAQLRPQVIALREGESDDGPVADGDIEPSETPESRGTEISPAPARSARIRWAQLLAPIYEVLPLLCPSRGGQMRILAFLTDPPVVRSILVHLDPGPPRNACIARGGVCPTGPRPSRRHVGHRPATSSSTR